MTLKTKVAIRGHISVHEVYAYCRTLVDTPENVEPISDDGTRPAKYLGNPLGIGLVALLCVDYQADGPMVHRHDKWCHHKVGRAEWDADNPDAYVVTQEDVDYHLQEAAETPTENGWAAMQVSFETGYSGKSDRGEDCSALHSRLVGELGKWLEAKGADWKWRNEYTGEWFDRDDQLAEFAGAHEQTGAAAWFESLVKPAIAVGLLEGLLEGER